MVIIGISALIIGILFLSFSRKPRTTKVHETALLPVHQEAPQLKIVLGSPQLRQIYFALRRQKDQILDITKELHYDNRELDLKRLGVDVSSREATLKHLQEKSMLGDLFQEIEFKKTALEQFFKENALSSEKERMELQTMLGNIEFGKKDLEQRYVAIEQFFKDKTFEHKSTALSLQEKGVDLKKNELLLMEKNLLLALREAEQRLKEQILEFKSQQLSFREEMASTIWKIKVGNDLLSIRKAKIEMLEHRIKELYTIKSEWLKIQARQNRQDFEKQQTQLKSLYNETQTKIRELKLTRWENNLIRDQEEVDRKWKIMEFIEEKWTAKIQHKDSFGTFWTTETNPYESLQDLKRSGYIPSSPLLQQLSELQSENWGLRNKISGKK